MPTVDLDEVTFPEKVINDMRDWIAEVEWADPPDMCDLTYHMTVDAIRRHYDGGLEAFLYDGDYLRGDGPIPYWHPAYTPTYDPDLVATLRAEDAAESTGRLDGDDRKTCFTHQAWIEHCVIDWSHANSVTGYNWCRVHGGPVQVCGCRPPTTTGW